MTALTASGYSKLVHLMLMFSATELLLEILQVKDKDSIDLLAPSERGVYLERLHRADLGARIMTAVNKDTRTGTLVKRTVEAYLRGDDASIFLLAKATRHAFAHGSLAPNVNGSTPTEVGRVVRILNHALNKMMDEQFGERMARFAARVPPRPPVNDDIPF